MNKTIYILSALLLALAVAVIMMSSYLWETHERRIYEGAGRES